MGENTRRNGSEHDQSSSVRAAPLLSDQGRATNPDALAGTKQIFQLARNDGKTTTRCGGESLPFSPSEG
jgi:hypothetical protein